MLVFGLTTGRFVLYCIVLYFRLFPNMGDKTHPLSVYDIRLDERNIDYGRNDYVPLPDKVQRWIWINIKAVFCSLISSLRSADRFHPFVLRTRTAVTQNRARAVVGPFTFKACSSLTHLGVN